MSPGGAVPGRVRPGTGGRARSVVGAAAPGSPPDCSGTSHKTHEPHAPHRGRSSGCSFNLPEGRLSKSVAKARIGPECRKRIADIPGFYSRPIRSRGAFATDLDTPRPGASQKPHPHHPAPAGSPRTDSSPRTAHTSRTRAPSARASAASSRSRGCGGRPAGACAHRPCRRPTRWACGWGPGELSLMLTCSHRWPGTSRSASASVAVARRSGAPRGCFSGLDGGLVVLPVGARAGGSGCPGFPARRTTPWPMNSEPPARSRARHGAAGSRPRRRRGPR